MGSVNVRIRSIESETPFIPPLRILLNKVTCQLVSEEDVILTEKHVTVNRLLRRRLDCEHSVDIKGLVGMRLGFTVICAVHIEGQPKIPRLKLLRLASPFMLRITQEGVRTLFQCTSASRNFNFVIELQVSFRPCQHSLPFLLRSVARDCGYGSRLLADLREGLQVRGQEGDWEEVRHEGGEGAMSHRQKDQLLQA
ncbi:hypothetical protein EON64_17915, partial [archaeon]